MKKFFEEFKAFALKGNVMDMAIGVIIGGAFTGIVTSLTDNFINPILNFVTGRARYGWNDILGFGNAFISSVINFIIMALILFFLVKGINAMMNIGKKPAEKTTKKCPYCQSDISIKATRCPHCTSQLSE